MSKTAIEILSEDVMRLNGPHLKPEFSKRMKSEDEHLDEILAELGINPNMFN